MKFISNTLLKALLIFKKYKIVKQSHCHVLVN